MQQPTEIDLTRTGFAVGATITPEMAAAVRKLLEGKDQALCASADLAINAERHLQAIAVAVYTIPDIDPVTSTEDCPVRFDPDAILAAILNMRREQEVYKWISAMWASSGPLHASPTKEQQKEIESALRTESLYGVTEIARRQIAESKKAINESRAQQRAKARMPITG